MVDWVDLVDLVGVVHRRRGFNGFKSAKSGQLREGATREDRWEGNRGRRRRTEDNRGKFLAEAQSALRDKRKADFTLKYL
jgi:hypothetical protein